MKITNKNNLPEPIYRAVSQVWKPREGSISVTNLIAPPIILTLTKRFWEEMEEDAGDRLWSLLGQGLHYALEKFTKGEYLAEERLKIIYNNIEVRGRADLYHDKTVEDYKITSVYSFLLGNKPEWEKQQNIYAALYRHLGFPVEKLRINAILRDHVKSKTYQSRDYPSIPFYSVDLRVWPPEKAIQFIKDRVDLHLSTPEAACSDEERWMRPGKFAVKKAGNKKALRLFDTREEAEKFADDFGTKPSKVKLEIEERPGVFVKCKDYCPVRKFCPNNPYRNQEQEVEDGPDAQDGQ